MEIFIIPGRLYLLKAQSSYFSIEIIKQFFTVGTQSQEANILFLNKEQLSSNLAEQAVTQFTKLNYTKKKLRDKF